MPDGTVSVDNRPATIQIPPGTLSAPHDGIREVPLDEINHLKAPLILFFDGQERYFEQVVQINNGDCVLASFLNTIAIEQTYQQGGQFGKLPMEVVEARFYANRLRKFMINPESPGSDYLFKGFPDGDIMNLFSSIYSESEFPDPYSSNYIRIDGSKSNMVESQTDAKDLLDILSNTDKYPSGLMVIGAQSHCQVVKRLDDGKYLLIDPAKHQDIDAKKYSTPGHPEEYIKAITIVSKMDLPHMIEYLGDKLRGDENASAFFIQHPKGAHINTEFV